MMVILRNEPTQAVVSEKVFGNSWSAQMGWRYVWYWETINCMSFQIEPMVTGPDVVYVPHSKVWLQKCPLWARRRANEILLRLKPVSWNRKLVWLEHVEAGFVLTTEPVPGSLEATVGGRQLESNRFFHPGSRLSHDEAHELWHSAASKFAAMARGRVTIVANGVVAGSVFEVIEIPALKANQQVILELK